MGQGGGTETTVFDRDVMAGGFCPVSEGRYKGPNGRNLADDADISDPQNVAVTA